MKDNRYRGLILVVIIGVVVQCFLIMADCKNTPGRAALRFTEAYFNLDTSMSEMLCEELVPDEDNNPIDQYLQRVTADANESGHDMNYMRSTLYGMHTDTVKRGDTHAEVHVQGARARNINPVFAFVAKLFFLGKTYPIDQAVEMVKEDGQWKVCGEPFSLIQG